MSAHWAHQVVIMVIRHSVLTEESKKADQEKFYSTLVATVAFPIATGILGAFTMDLWNYSRALTLIAWLFVGVAFAIAYIRTFPSSRSFIALSLANEDLEHEIGSSHEDVEALEQSIELLSALNAINYSTRRMAAAYIKSPPTGLHLVPKTPSLV